MQGNLKQTYVPDANECLPPPADLRAADWGQEHLWLADYQRDHSSVISSAVLQRPRLGLSFLPVRIYQRLDVNFCSPTHSSPGPSLSLPGADLLPASRMCGSHCICRAPHCHAGRCSTSPVRSQPRALLTATPRCAGVEGRSGALHRHKRAVEARPVSCLGARRGESARGGLTRAPRRGPACSRVKPWETSSTSPCLLTEQPV